MKIKNNFGDRLEPGGTPALMFLDFETLSLTRTWNDLPLSKTLMIFVSWEGIPT